MNKIIIITIALFCSLTGTVLAQMPDSISTSVTSLTPKIDSTLVQNNIQLDSLNVAKDSLRKKKKFRLLAWVKEGYPNPKKALILSAIPGMGQAYNKKYWKIPIVYAAIGGLAFTIDLNNRQYNRLQTAFLATVDDDATTVSEFAGTQLDNSETLRTLRNSFDKSRQLSWFGLVAVYILGGVDAFVDGHLLDFDVSDDLSLKIKPDASINLATSSPALGIGLSLQW